RHNSGVPHTAHEPRGHTGIPPLRLLCDQHAEDDCRRGCHLPTRYPTRPPLGEEADALLPNAWLTGSVGVRDCRGDRLDLPTALEPKIDQSRRIRGQAAVDPNRTIFTLPILSVSLPSLPWGIADGSRFDAQILGPTAAPEPLGSLTWC